MAETKSRRRTAGKLGDEEEGHSTGQQLKPTSLWSLPPGLHPDGGDLYLQVTPNRKGRSWVFRYRSPVTGKPREMGLGPLKKIALRVARQRAKEAWDKVHVDRIDPLEERRAKRLEGEIWAAKPTKTFKQCATEYIAMQRLTWRNPKHAAQWASTLATYAFPVFGDVDLRDIDTTMVLNVLDPIWSTKPETANRVRGRIEAILDWAKPRGYRDGENPARLRGHLDQSLPRLSKVKRAKRESAGREEHHAAMPYDEIGAFMQRLRARQELTARMLEFTILTAMRTQTVIGARKGEIDLHERVWNIPANRIGADGTPESSGLKRKGEFRVPLSDAACRVIEPFVDGDPDDHLFPGESKSGGLSNMAMLNLLQEPDRMALPQYTVHGFRSTFRDWGGDCTNFESHLLELALAHTLSDKVEAAYRRGDGFRKRQQLMDEWANYCGSSRADIVDLGERRAAS